MDTGNGAQTSERPAPTGLFFGPGGGQSAAVYRLGCCVCRFGKYDGKVNGGG
jgi:hypothetical protein